MNRNAKVRNHLLSDTLLRAVVQLRAAASHRTERSTLYETPVIEGRAKNRGYDIVFTSEKCDGFWKWSNRFAYSTIRRESIASLSGTTLPKSHDTHMRRRLRIAQVTTKGDIGNLWRPVFEAAVCSMPDGLSLIIVIS